MATVWPKIGHQRDGITVGFAKRAAALPAKRDNPQRFARVGEGRIDDPDDPGRVQPLAERANPVGPGFGRAPILENQLDHVDESLVPRWLVDRDRELADQDVSAIAREQERRIVERECLSQNARQPLEDIF